MNIAPLISLASLQESCDIGMFTMLWAQLPNTIFQKILLDLHNLVLQYGSICQHYNEKARSRFLFAVR